MRRRSLGWMMIGVALAMSATGEVRAQVSWETPTLYAPGAPAGFGIFLMEPWPGSGIGVLGTYRAAPIPSGLGFRLGVGEGPGENLAVFGGVDLGGSLVRPSGDVPIEVLWMAGAGLGVGDDVLLSFPLGLSIGARLDADQATFTPYAVPRLVLDACLGDEVFRSFCGPDDDLSLDLAIDIGVDLAFNPGWMIRFAATLGDRDALLIGLAFPR